MNRTTVISSLLWKLLERGGTQGIQLIVQVILARLLLPEDFGTLAIVMVFISLARVFVQSGFNIALIQKKDADEVDFSSVFYLSLAIAGILYLFVYLSAPLVASFYGDLLLAPVLRVLSFTLFFGAFISVQNAYVAKNMMFKKLFISSLGSVVVSGTIGILVALRGWGVWALVVQQLVSQLVTSIIMWFTVHWRPRLLFSFSRVKSLFAFGSRLLASSLLNALYMDLRTLIIGRVYSPTMLGYYNQGQQLPNVVVSNVSVSIQSVMLPTLASHQDNTKRVKDMMRRAIVSSSFLIFPMMIGMAVVADPLVAVVFTEKWLPAVPFLRIFCLSYSLIPIHTANLQAINALGRSDIFLRLEVIKKILGLAILAASLPFGVHAVAIGQIVSSIVSTFINARPNRKLLGYSYMEQWKDIMPSLVIALGMGLVVYALSFIGLQPWKQLALQVVTGVVVYIGLAKLFNIECFTYLLTSICELRQQRRNMMP